MAQGRFADLFDVAKPVIAMAHFPALPGTPRYRRGTSIDELVDHVRTDLDHLLAGGVDGILFCNEDDRPYSLHAGIETPSIMAAAIAEMRPRDRPFGVDVLWDPMAAIALAKATGASFVREVVTGAYESDMGIWAPDAAALYRYRSRIDADDVLVLANPSSPRRSARDPSRSAREAPSPRPSWTPSSSPGRWPARSRTSRSSSRQRRRLARRCPCS